VRYQEIKPKPNVGREFQHLEDLVFIEGTVGAKHALRILENLSESTQGVSVKWDGNPTIYWGRNPAGEFVLVNKNAWGKTECTNADMLEEFILTSGKGEPWRPAFAESLVKIWPLVEAATPHWVRGYVYGDLLFYPNKPAQLTNETVEFTPNKVTYNVSTNSKLGKKLSEAEVCIAAHSLHKNFGDKEGYPFQEGQIFENSSVSVISQTRVTANTLIEKEKINSLRHYITDDIDQFLAPQAGLSDLRNILYTYVNQLSKAKKLEHLSESFFDWLETSKVSKPKQAKILALADSNPNALPAIFSLVSGIMSIKNSVIEQIDSNNTEIVARTLNEAGGEGYIMLDEKIKLVPRHRWVPN
jgi:hypothetical protein